MGSSCLENNTLEDERGKCGAFQVEELQNKRPLVPADLRLPPAQQEVMDTFRTAMLLGPKALGAYVISMASSPSDILTVVLLQKTAATTIARCAPQSC